MCNITAIAALIASASAALIAALVSFGVAAVAAGTFWGAFGNSIPMGIAAGLIGGALAAVGAAIAQVSSCRFGRCKAAADTLFYALAGAFAALSVLLGAVIAGIFFASIPWVGVAVVLGLAAGGVGCAISLGYISSTVGVLAACLSPGTPETTAVTVAKWFSGAASVGSTVFAFATGTAGGAQCFGSPSSCGPR